MQRQFAEVRATATGATLARVTPPRPYRTFIAAAGAGDGRTFVLVAGPWVVTYKDGGKFIREAPTKFFLLHIGAGGHTTRLTALPIPRQPGGASGIALSPDGSKLAVALRDASVGGPAIQVFDVATGSEQVWTWPGGGPVTNNAGDEGEVLSWAADNRTLAFQQWVTGEIIHLRLLDTTTPGGSLQAASRLVLRWPGDGATWHYVHGKISNVLFGFSAIITPDGSKIVAATEDLTKHPLSSALAFTEFSAATGKVVKVLGRWPIPGLYPGQTQDVLWTNSSGSTLIVLAHKPGVPTKDPRSINSAGYGIEFGVLHGNQFTPLPGAPAPGPNPWPVW
jgi:Tol biopolymer transport system component